MAIHSQLFAIDQLLPCTAARIVPIRPGPRVLLYNPVPKSEEEALTVPLSIMYVLYLPTNSPIRIPRQCHGRFSSS